MPEVTLTVNGTDYGGWKSMRLARGIEQAAGSFELGVSELWPGQRIVREIAPLDKCTVSIDGAVVITGYVDIVSIDYDERDHKVTVEGRDATADLVDSSAIHKTGKWYLQKMERIAADLLAPFGIGLVTEVDTGNVIDWKIEEGDSVFECLERLARAKAVLLTSDGKGALVITRAGKGGRVSEQLVRGQNIKAAGLKLGFRERFSRYIVKGFGNDGDALFADAARMKAEASDAMIDRYRPLIVIAENAVDAAALKRRALWEANVRAGKSAHLALRVQGWTHGGGLWQPNTIVHVRDEWTRTDADLLVKQVLFTLDEGGSITELQLAPPQAFDLIPLPKEKADPWEMLGRQSRDIGRLKRQHERFPQ